MVGILPREIHPTSSRGPGSVTQRGAAGAEDQIPTPDALGWLLSGERPISPHRLQARPSG